MEMTDIEDRVPYEERDYAIMANNVYLQLCQMDREDRNVRESQWHEITTLAERVGAFDNRIDVAYLAETTLLDELRYMERDINNKNVRLTLLGRQNCDKGIDIPPSDIQKLKQNLDM